MKKTCLCFFQGILLSMDSWYLSLKDISREILLDLSFQKKTPTSATRSPSRPWVLGTRWRTKESREGFHDPSIEVFEATSTSLIRGWRFHKNGCPQHFGPKGIFSTHLGFALKTVFYQKNDKNKLQIKQTKTPALTVKSQSQTPHLPSPKKKTEPAATFFRTLRKKRHWLWCPKKSPSGGHFWLLFKQVIISRLISSCAMW